MIFDAWSCFSLSAPRAPGRPWRRRGQNVVRDPRSFPRRHAQTCRERYACGAALVRLRACVHRRPSVGGVAEVKNAVRADRSLVRNICPGWKRRDSFGTVLIGCVATYLLAERKVVAASSMRDHALSKRELACIAFL